MNIFEPDPDRPYGACKSCEDTFPTKEDMSAHLSATFKAGKSHRARVINPTRGERVFNALDNEVDSLLDDFISRAWRLVDQGASEDEVLAAMKRIDIDFIRAWEESA